jgi:serine/threonine-protein kinase RsbW
VTARRAAVPADAAQLTVLTSFLREFGMAVALDAAQVSTFELALEEIFMNIVMHGSRPGMAPRVEVSLHRDAESVTMTVEDDGPQFDPLSLPPPDVTTSVAEDDGQRQLRAHCGAQPAAHEQAPRRLTVIRGLARGHLTRSSHPLTLPPTCSGKKNRVAYPLGERLVSKGWSLHKKSVGLNLSRGKLRRSGGSPPRSAARRGASCLPSPNRTSSRSTTFSDAPASLGSSMVPGAGLEAAPFGTGEPTF